MTHDDAPLIQATLRGDSQAYGKLVQKYQDRLLTALVHVCSSRHEAEDALQDAFVQAYPVSYTHLTLPTNREV